MVCVRAGVTWVGGARRRPRRGLIKAWKVCGCDSCAVPGPFPSRVLAACLMHVGQCLSLARPGARSGLATTGVASAAFAAAAAAAALASVDCHQMRP